MVCWAQHFASPEIASVYALNTTADAYVRDGSSAGVNFVSAKDLEIKNSTSGFNRVTYVKFDLSCVSTVRSVSSTCSAL